MQTKSFIMLILKPFMTSFRKLLWIHFPVYSSRNILHITHTHTHTTNGEIIVASSSGLIVSSLPLEA